MHYVLEGEIDHIDAGGETYHLGPGGFFEFRAGCLYRGYPTATEDFCEAVLIIDARTHAACCRLGMLRLDPVVGAAGLDAGLCSQFEQLQKELGRRFKRVTEPWPLAQAVAWIDAIHAAGRKRVQGETLDPLVLRAGELLGERLETRDDVRGLLAPLGVSYESFRKRFRVATGQSPGEYRIRRRIDRACLMLFEGARVKEVAAELGYADPFVFSEQFTRRVGIPPRDYRRLGGM